MTIFHKLYEIKLSDFTCQSCTSSEGTWPFYQNETWEALCLKVDVIYWWYHLTSTSSQKPQRFFSLERDGRLLVYFFFLCALGRASLEDIKSHKAAAKVETFGRLTILTDRTNWAAWDLFIHSYLVSWVNFSVYLLETIEQVTILFYLNTFNEQERSRKKKKIFPGPLLIMTWDTVDTFFKYKTWKFNNTYRYINKSS